MEFDTTMVEAEDAVGGGAACIPGAVGVERWWLSPLRQVHWEHLAEGEGISKRLSNLLNRSPSALGAPVHGGGHSWSGSHHQGKVVSGSMRSI